MEGEIKQCCWRCGSFNVKENYSILYFPVYESKIRVYPTGEYEAISTPTGEFEVKKIQVKGVFCERCVRLLGYWIRRECGYY